MDLLQQIQEMQERAESATKLEAKYLTMFELAGVDLYHRDVMEDGTEKVGPKTVEELIAEVLHNPPSEPGKWIRIQSIPAYINDYLILPEKSVVDDFNNSASKAKVGAKRKTGSYMDRSDDSFDDAPDVEDPLPEGRNVNDLGELEPEVERTGQSWLKAGYVPVKTTLVDELGVIWYKHDKNQWINVTDQASDEPVDFWFDVDVTPGGPLYETVEKANIEL